MSRLLALTPAQLADLERRLARLAADAPGGALLTVTLDLGRGQPEHDCDWLDCQPQAAEFCYWAQPAKRRHRLGIGRAVVCTSAGPARFTALQAAHAGIAQHWRHDDGGIGSGCRPVACLGFAFDDDSAEILPNAQLGVAAVQLDHAEGRLSASFTTTARDAADALQRWQALLAAKSVAPDLSAGGTLPNTTLAMQAWRQRVDAALRAIAAGVFAKVVLSRSLRLNLNTVGSPVALLRRLVRRHAGSTIYAMGNARGVFLGATPERLVSLADGRLQADALAGTAWDDQPLAADKNLREQQLVVDAVREALTPLCRTLDIPEQASVLQLPDLQHLRTPVSGITHAQVGLFDLIARLHPTPAVGGWPGAAAGDWLRRHGERRPGWYGGGIGWADRSGNGEVAVALRCALLTPPHIELSAGAGIVAGSLPDQEFAETEAKLRTVLDALRGDGEACEPIARTGTQ